MIDERDWQRARPASGLSLGLSRRRWIAGGASALSLALLGCEVSSAAPKRRMPVRSWIERQGELARALRSGEIAPILWMDEVERLAREIEIPELMSEIDRSQVKARALLPTNDPRKKSVRFLDETGEPRRFEYAAALFDFAPENVITPHGHRHMVSSHLVVDGAFRVRNYDRLRDEEGAMIVRPSRDYIAQTGDLSAMTPEKDNIHWFVPEGGRATTFDVIISGIDPGQPEYKIEAIDPYGGEALANGDIRAPKIGFIESSDKYTAAI